MSSKKKHAPIQRPIDAIREMIEEQTLQISDLTQIVKTQDHEIKMLRAKWKARESIEKEEAARKKAEADKSWFWAARSSE
jgi:predicted RNase H-like nuclease (RuvC/YqgF family)